MILCFFFFFLKKKKKKKKKKFVEFFIANFLFYTMLHNEILY